MNDLSWNPENAPFIAAMLWSALGFAAYYFLSQNKSLASRIWKAPSDLEPSIKEVVIQRGWGFIFLGLASAFIITVVLKDNLFDYGLGFSFQSPPPLWTYLVIPAILTAGYFSASKPGNLALYPQMRIQNWTPGVLLLSSISWVIFLTGYEFLFRGFLFYSALTLLPPWSAIALNCSLYAFAHLYKGPGEAFGAIPLGILLCYITLLTGNIWSAVIIHSIMALSNEWYSIRFNREMNMHVPNRRRTEGSDH